MATQEQINEVKLNTQESEFPMYTDEEIGALIDSTGSVNAASYRICLLKSMDDAVTLGPISLSSNKDYWLKLAEYFRVLWEEEKNKAISGGEGGTFTFQRADENW